MKKLILFILTIFIFICGIKNSLAQNSKIDSLQTVLKNSITDTNKIKTLNELSTEFCNVGSYNDAVVITELSKKLANRLITTTKNQQTLKVIKKGLARAYNNFGNIYSDQGLFTDALENYFASLKIKEEIKDKKGIASAYNNIGIVYKTQGNLNDALHNYKASLKIKEELGDKQGIASSYNNLGNIYHIQNNFEKALESYSSALVIFKEIGFALGVTSIYNNMGAVYYNRAEQLKDKSSKLQLLENARANYNASLAIFEEIGDKRGVAATLINIGNVELKENKPEKAKEYANRAFAISTADGGRDILKDSYSLLSQIEENTGNYKLAFYHFKDFLVLRDSLFSEENTKKTVQMQMQFGFDKKMAADSIANAKSQEIKEIEIAKQKAEIKVKKNQQYALFGGLLLVIIFAGFMYNRFKVTKKQKQIIELQKQEVELQKEIVEDKNKEITDSIYYAKRIQAAILPPLRIVKEFLPESFIVYKPKDIVAGDFYWLETKNREEQKVKSEEESSHNIHQSKIVLFAAADCTGHGVPGAMVSVICNNGLNRSVREHDITDPGKILDKTREIVIQEFEKSDDVVKDGMDISLCALQGKTLKWAGANNPLWIIRPNNDGFELLETKPNKQHIGKVEDPKPFTTHTLELQKNDTIYIFSDGYKDQFGGVDGKKFKSSKFKELLLSIQHKNMDQQKEIIIQTFDKWKGNLYQIDDICVIGVKI